MPSLTRRFALSEDLVDRLDLVVGRTGRSADQVVEEAVDRYLRDEERRVAAIAAGDRSLAGGHAHSADQIFAWMDEWGTASDRPAPEPDVTLDDLKA